MKRLSIFCTLILGLVSILVLPVDVQRSMHRFIVYCLLCFSMYFLYRTTLILPLGQCLFFATGSYCTVIFKTYGWLLGVILALLVALLIYFLLKRLESMYFSLGSLCFMLIGQELFRILHGITGGTDGIFRAFQNGLSKGLFLSMLLACGLLWYYMREMKGRLYYEAYLIESGREYAEAFGVSVERVRAKVFVGMSLVVTITGISNALTQGYIVPSTVFNPSLTIIPLAVALISRNLWEIFIYLLALLGLQEILGYVGLGIQGMVLGGILMSLGYRLMTQED